MTEPAATPPAGEGTPPAGEGTPPAAEGTPPANDSWMSALPAEMQGNPTLQDVKSVEALAQRFIDTKSMVGNSIRVPGQDASTEDMAAFRQSLLDKNVGLMAVPNSEDAEAMQAVYKQLGMPDAADGYSRPENWAGMTDERYGHLSAIAHKAGISKGQFEQVVSALSTSDNEVSGKYAGEHQAGIDQLKGEWGGAYEQKVARATNIAKQLEAPPALQEAMANNQVDAATLRWMDSVAEKFGGEGNTLVNDPGMVSEHTPTELQERFDEITKRMFDMNPSDPQYKALQAKRLKYMEMLTPES